MKFCALWKNDQASNHASKKIKEVMYVQTCKISSIVPDLTFKTTNLKTTNLKITNLKITNLKITNLKTTNLKTTDLKTTDLTNNLKQIILKLIQIISKMFANMRKKYNRDKNAYNPEEELLILRLSENSRKIARLLSSETSIRILKLLSEKSMSAGNLADELGLRLNTLKYNPDSLLKAGMIRVRHVKWSRKGREIKIYEAAEKVLVLLPARENLDTSLF